MPWKSIFFWILIIVLVILWCALIIDIVILFNAKTRIDNGAAEDGIKYSEVSFSIVMTIALVVILPFVIGFAIYWWLRGDKRANDLLQRFNTVVDVTANASGLAIEKPIIDGLRMLDASKAQFATTTSQSIQSVNQSIEQIINVVRESECNQGEKLINYIQRIGQGINSNLDQINGTAQISIGDTQQLIKNIKEAAVNGGIAGGSQVVQSIVQASKAGSSTAAAAAASIPVAAAAATSVGSCSSGFLDKLRGYFSGGPQMNPLFSSGNIMPGSNPGARCNDGSNPPCGNYQDFVANVSAAPPNGWSQYRWNPAISGPTII